MSKDVDNFYAFNEKRGLFLENLVKCFGNKTYAAQITGCTRQAVFYWEKESDEYKELVKKAVKEGEELELEACAGVVQEAAVIGKDWKAAIALLERKHKKRGWNKSVEHTGVDGKPIQHVINEQDSAIMSMIEGVEDEAS